MNRNEIFVKIKNSMSRNHDVSELSDDCFYAEFHSRDEKYFATEKINIWAVEDNEYAYVHSVEELDEKLFCELLEKSLADGLPRIVPGPNHRCSSIKTIIICDSAGEDVLRKTKKYRFVKNYKLSLHGWCEHGVAVAVLSTKNVVCNTDAKDAAKNLKKLCLVLKK